MAPINLDLGEFSTLKLSWVELCLLLFSQLLSYSLVIVLFLWKVLMLVSVLFLGNPSKHEAPQEETASKTFQVKGLKY